MENSTPKIVCELRGNGKVKFIYPSGDWEMRFITQEDYALIEAVRKAKMRFEYVILGLVAIIIFLLGYLTGVGVSL